MECDLDWRCCVPHLHSGSIHQHSTDHYYNKSRLKNWHTEADRPLWTCSLTQDHIIFSNPHILCTSPLVRTKDWRFGEEYFSVRLYKSSLTRIDCIWDQGQTQTKWNLSFDPHQWMKQNPRKVITVFILQCSAKNLYIGLNLDHC